jgi:hypothetical protein
VCVCVRAFACKKENGREVSFRVFYDERVVVV